MPLLNQLVSIQTGLFAKPQLSGDVVYLQAKHFDESGHLQASLHPDLLLKDISVKHLLIPGDVLFASKGNKIFATVFESHNPPSVASTTFFVLRIKDQVILPGYLAWYLNQSLIQREMKEMAFGSTMVSISKSILEDVEINLPSISKQENIIKISALRNSEKKLNQRIDSLKDIQLQQQLLKAIEND